jgi:hypothetical protein
MESDNSWLANWRDGTTAWSGGRQQLSMDAMIPALFPFLLITVPSCGPPCSMSVGLSACDLADFPDTVPLNTANTKMYMSMLLKIT